MTITRETVRDQLLAYLNHDLTQRELASWAERSAGETPDADTDDLHDILRYLAAADSHYFPLTWEICTDFMQRLGTPVKVVAREAN